MVKKPRGYGGDGFWLDIHGDAGHGAKPKALPLHLSLALGPISWALHLHFHACICPIVCLSKLSLAQDMPSCSTPLLGVKAETSLSRMHLDRSGSAEALPHIPAGYWEVTEEKIIICFNVY